MRVPKLERYRQLSAFPNLLEPQVAALLNAPFELCGKWNDSFFGRTGTLILEMGCGWGDFALDLARRFPDRNILGLDVKGGRIWRGAKTALEEGLKNVGFIRVEGEGLVNLFAPGELGEIWVTFPTPYLRKPEKMLVSPTYLSRYRTLLSRDGILRVKTDVELLAAYIHKLWPLCGFRIVQSTELPAEYRLDSEMKREDSRTNFEARANEQKKTIRYICAVPLSGEVGPIPEDILRCPWSSADTCASKLNA